MATPTVLINNSTGSDTLASGAGPSVALTGTAGATSGTGLVVTLDGSPSLAGVLTDGSHVIWVNTAAGRQFAAITAKDDSAKTVTVTTAFTINLTGRTWAIGGKRATLDEANTRKLFSADNLAGWAVDLQETGTNYTLTSTLSIASPGLAILSSSTNRPTITTATNSVRLFTYTNACAGLKLSHLAFSSTATTRLPALFPSGAVATAHCYSDCSFDGFTVTGAIDGSNGAGSYFVGLQLDACEFKSGITAVVNASPGTAKLVDCFLHDLTGIALTVSGDYACVRCVFARNDRAMNLTGNNVTFLHCVIQGCTSVTQPAVVFTPTSAGGSLVLIGNVFHGNSSTFAVSISAAGGPIPLVNRYNAYGGNVADRLGLAAGTGDVTLTANPFANAAGNDFTLNSTAGGGAALKAIVPNVRAPGLAGTSLLDAGPFQAAASSGGGTIYYAL